MFTDDMMQMTPRAQPLLKLFGIIVCLLLWALDRYYIGSSMYNMYGKLQRNVSCVSLGCLSIVRSGGVPHHIR